MMNVLAICGSLGQVCVFLDLRPLNKPEVFVNAFAGNFDQQGNLTDERIQQLVKEQLQSWTQLLRT